MINGKKWVGKLKFLKIVFKTGEESLLGAGKVQALNAALGLGINFLPAITLLRFYVQV